MNDQEWHAIEQQLKDTDIQHSTAWSQGNNATSIEDCAYPEGHFLREQWMAGFKDYDEWLEASIPLFKECRHRLSEGQWKYLMRRK